MTSHVAVHSICMYIINHPGLGADHALSFQLFISIQWDIFSCDGVELAALNRGLEQGSERLRRAEINWERRCRLAWERETQHVMSGSLSDLAASPWRHYSLRLCCLHPTLFTSTQSSDKCNQAFNRLWAEATCCLVFGPCRIVGYCSRILMNTSPLWDVREDQVRLITPHSQGKQPNALWC